jgi:hypothetical protein
MKFARFVCVFILFAVTTVLAQTNPVPFVNQPLVPTAVAPGGPGFTLTVNGTGFVSTSTINWNGTPLATTFVNSSQLTATVPAANIATASTASITVSSPSPGGGTSNVLFFQISAPTTLQFTFFAETQGVAQQAIVADFTGNGNLDFAINACFGQNDCPIIVYLGNGAGLFQNIDQDFQAVNAFADGDFNGDGKLDLVGTNCIDGEQICTLYILLGNGDGTFSPYGNGITLPFYSGLVETGDFNGDGKLDVAIAPQTSTGGVYVFLGNGDGTFQNALISNVGTLSTFGGVGDFNGDGKLDLMGVLTSNQLAFLQGNGDGTFQAPTTYYSVGADTGTILAADLNGDGKLDLVTVQGSPTNTFTVFLGNGDGTFQPQTPSPVSSLNPAGAIGDMNADGKLDLVLSSNTQTLILPGNGDGTFQTPVAASYPSTSSAIGDFNNDGKPDLVLVAYGYLLQQVPVANLDPSTTISFGSQMLGTTSPPYPIMLSNAGSAPLIVSSMTITGANPNDFAFKSFCGLTPTLQTYDHCQINVTFTPTAAGSRAASFTVASNGIGSPTSVGLAGNGVAPPPLPYLSPTSVTFPSQYVGTSGLPQSVTLTNPASTALVISNVTATPADFAPLSTCGSTLAAGASCSIGVFFDPTTSGTRNGTLTVTDNATNSPQTATLTGTGQDFSLAPGSQSSATVSPGQSASYKVSVAPDGGFDQTVTLSCTGAPTQSTCSVSPSSVKLSGSTATATVTVTTSGGSAGLTQPINGPGSNMFGLWVALSGALGLAMMLSLRRWRRELRPRLLYGLAFLCLVSVGITMSACGGGGGSGGSGGGGTQAGTYNLTVTGTFTSGSTNLTHKTSLTLVVQ